MILSTVFNLTSRRDRPKHMISGCQLKMSEPDARCSHHADFDEKLPAADLRNNPRMAPSAAQALQSLT